jgi:hypothetical protein
MPQSGPYDYGRKIQTETLPNLGTIISLHDKGSSRFDTAVQSIPPHLQDHERAWRRLALLIVRRMDSGEPDADLGTVALLDFLRAT